MRIEKEGPTMIEGKHQRVSFLVCIPTLGMVPIEFHVAASRLAMPVNALSQSLIVSKTEVGVARQYAAEFVLNIQPRPRYLLFLGDDMLPPWDGVIRLWQEMEEGQWDVLSGLYFIKQDYPVPIIWRDDVIGPLEAYKHYQPGEVVPCDVVGMDFTLIRPSVFEKIEKPFFKTGPGRDMDPGGGLTVYTEDVYFCSKARAAGLKIGCHTGVRVSHLYAKTGEVW